MQIYDFFTGEPVESPDLEKGYLVLGTIVTGYTTETFPETITGDRPNGIKHRVPIIEECQFYYPNPEEPEVRPDPGESSDSATWEELAKAYNEGVMSVGE